MARQLLESEMAPAARKLKERSALVSRRFLQHVQSGLDLANGLYQRCCSADVTQYSNDKNVVDKETEKLRRAPKFETSQ